MKKIEKITVYVASDYGYDTLTRVIEILTDDIMDRDWETT